MWRLGESSALLLQILPILGFVCFLLLLFVIVVVETGSLADLKLTDSGRAGCIHLSPPVQLWDYKGTLPHWLNLGSVAGAQGFMFAWQVCNLLSQLSSPSDSLLELLKLLPAYCFKQGP